MFVEILPPQVRSRIAAGEVISSPSDIVKELVENSLDAKATRIEIEISKGGKRLIVVRDNGEGIHPEDIDKVFLEGATSKIRSEEDLLKLTTYGFRGEALHSIASVSRMKIKSRYFQQKEGWQVEVEAGLLIQKEKTGMPVGTEVEIRDLFFNLPVRRKFLRREDTERNKIRDLIKEYALVNNAVEFKLISNGKEILFFPASEKEERIKQILGENFEVYERKDNTVWIKIYIRRNIPQGRVYIFVNSRPVKNRNLKEFLRKVVGFKTAVALFIEVPPFAVDFNIHPKKREVKFINERKLLSLLRETLKEKKDPFVTNYLLTVPKAYRFTLKVLGQISETILVVQYGDYIYFFDQHLLSERINYEKGKMSADKACKISLKSGVELSPDAIREMIKEWESLENPHVCPHGRPIYYRIALSEVYNKLGRSF